MKKQYKKTSRTVCFLRLLSLLLLLSLLAGCSSSRGSMDSTGQSSAEGTTIDKNSDLTMVKTSGLLRIGVIPGKPLFYQDEEKGEWTGYCAEAARQYAQSLGLKPEFVEIDPLKGDQLLEAKKIDCVWGRVSWTDSQKYALSFSQPYLKDKLAVIVHFKNKDKEKCKDRNNITKMREFVVVEGSPGEEKAKEIGANYSTEKDVVHCLLRVAAGTASCALVDVYESTSMIGDGTQYENLVYTVTFDMGNLDVGFRKDSDLVPTLDSWLAAFYQDGSALKTARKYRISKMILEVK